jgi:Family of unknown function (DUF5682)
MSDPLRAPAPTDDPPLAALTEQLREAAAAFSADGPQYAELLRQIARDVERALAEPLEILPVCHHSPASALHMLRRLSERAPRVIYIELCEDLRPLMAHLADCALPVALQAFAAESGHLPAEALPVSVVVPLTEASAEYQAIAFALTHPDTELVFVDRAVEYVFAWDAGWQRHMRSGGPEETPDRESGMHGASLGVALGDLMPTFDRFLEFLLRNSHTRHFSEWWDQYVERAVIDGDYASYRQALFLVGSLIRHLGRPIEHLEEDRLRERYMWTRIKQHLRASGVAPQDAIYICGAAHAASDVPEFGAAADAIWEIPPVAPSRWLYGLIPSSFSAIEYQFQHPAGAVGLADERWQKALKAHGVRPYSLQKPESAGRRRSAQVPPPPPGPLLTRVPTAELDEAQLVGWCAQIVALARRHGYLASTADSIAIYQTALLLAQLRNRAHPSPFDFQDAAVTCLEKDRTPRRRTIAQLCRTLLGGDRVGTVGYASLPPLAQDVIDRLAPLQIDLIAKTNQRALLDLRTRPDLRPCSALLWKLRYLLGDQVVEPIMGELQLGSVAVQESWDLRLGRHQRGLIQLGYEGVTIEQVLELRMKQAAYAEQATAALALQTAEEALIYDLAPRLVRELGEQAARLLADESGAGDAPAIFTRARRLVHHYRTSSQGLPAWIEHFVTVGYEHYAALLPSAFGDQGTTPEQIGGMLGFIFTLESFALAMGSQRSQLIIGLQQAAFEQVPAEKIGLLWGAEWLVGLRDLPSIREHLTALLRDELRLPSVPGYLRGFVLALGFAPGLARLVVELVSEIFAHLPERHMITLLPELLLQLRESPALLQPLIREAAAVFPTSLSGFAGWEPPWMGAGAVEDAGERAAQGRTPDEEAVRALLLAAPDTAAALAALI